ncbi:MAG: hypothetical protein AAF092_08040 [Pseudomonadota bacterium]
MAKRHMRVQPVYTKTQVVLASLGGGLVGLLGVVAVASVTYALPTANKELSFLGSIALTLRLGVPMAFVFSLVVVMPFMAWFMKRSVTQYRAVMWAAALTVLPFLTFLVFFGMLALLTGLEVLPEGRLSGNTSLTTGIAPLSLLAHSVAQWLAFIAVCIGGASVLQRVLGPGRRPGMPK